MEGVPGQWRVVRNNLVAAAQATEPTAARQQYVAHLYAWGRADLKQVRPALPRDYADQDGGLCTRESGAGSQHRGTATGRHARRRGPAPRTSVVDIAHPPSPSALRRCSVSSRSGEMSSVSTLERMAPTRRKANAPAAPAPVVGLRHRMTVTGTVSSVTA